MSAKPLQYNSDGLIVSALSATLTRYRATDFFEIKTPPAWIDPA